MAKYRHLSKAPIKEAVIDLRVVLRDDINSEALLEGYERVRADYPIKEDLQEGKFGVQIDQGNTWSTSLQHSWVGFRATSHDKYQVVQFRVNGFAFSRLQPYQTWEQMLDEARRLWQVYLEIANPEKVIRIATRFINVMTIRGSVRDMANYLISPPRLPEALPYELGGFATRFVANDSKRGAVANIIQAMESAGRDSMSITLDVDVFTTQDYDPMHGDYWNCLQRLREIKNEIFFESITEKTAEIFE